MKKTGIFAMLLAGALIFSMGVGCGEKEDQGGTQQGGTEHTHAFAEGWTSDGEYHWHEATCGHADAVTKEAHTFTNNECSVCGYYKIDQDTDISAIVSDRLTEEEWEKALSEETLDNFIASGSQERVTGVVSFAGKNWQQAVYMDGIESMISCLMIEFKDDLISCYMGELDDTADSGELYWERVKLTQEKYENKIWEYGGAMRLELRYLCEKYSQMTYDETLGAYLFAETDKTHGDYANETLVLKFKNGKLCCFGYEDSRYVDYVVYGYGEAKIVPPTEFQEREAHGDDWD